MEFDKQVNDSGLESIEYLKETDYKEQIETLNTDIEKDPMGESEAPVTKAPEEEEIQDEGILNPTDKSEGVDESDNIRQQAKDGENNMKKIHTISIGDEKLENVSLN